LTYEIEEQEIFAGNYAPRITRERIEERLRSASNARNLEEFLTSSDHVLYSANLPAFFSWLVSRGELIPLSSPTPSGEIVVRSKIGELARLLLHLPFRRWIRKRREYAFSPSVSIVKYHRQIKKVPEWDQDILTVIGEIVDESQTHFERYGRTFYYDGLGSSSDRQLFERCVKSVLEGFQDYVSRKPRDIPPGEVKLSDFQVRCIKETLRMRFVGSELYPRDLVMTAGAGSGKTFAFLLGILIALLFDKCKQERLQRGPGALRCLIVYPRVSLSKDQHEICRLMLKAIEKRANKDYNLNIELQIEGDFGGEFWREGGSVYDKLKSFQIKVPDMIITNTETLKRRVKDPAAQPYFSALRFVVFDEIHLYEAIEGSHVAKLNERVLGRTRLSTGNYRHRPIYIGASATIAEPVEHCSKLFPEVEFGKIQHVSANESPTLTNFGFFHHVLVKIREGRSAVGTLTDLTSCVLHNFFGREEFHRLNRIIQNGERMEDATRKQPKMIGFSDSLSIVSRWKDLIRDQEKSFWRGLWSSDRGTPGPETQRFPFYGMFHSPLSWRCFVLYRRARSWAGTAQVQLTYSKKDIDALLQCYRDAREICRKCKQGKDATLDLSSYLSGQVLEFTLANLMPAYPDREMAEAKIRNMEQCPFLRRAICWWASSSSARRFQLFPTEEGGPRMKGYYDNIRTRISTARTREKVRPPNEEFASTFRDIYGSTYVGDARAEIPDFKLMVPFLISSPVMEVGVDISNLKGTILHKAIRNLSSYKQKIGRAGRERNSHALAVSLVSYDPRERHYFRNSFMLADPNILEPISLKRDNVDVQKCHALEGCFDFFASIGWDIYNVPKRRRDFDVDGATFSERVKAVEKSDYLCQEQGSFKNKALVNYLVETMRMSEEVAVEAISVFKEYMKILGSRNISAILDSQENCLASLWESIADGTLPSEPGKVVTGYKEDLELLRKLDSQLKRVLDVLSDESRIRLKELFGAE